MIRALLIEDELPAARRLAKMILQSDASIEIEATLDSVETAVVWLQTHPHPDLLFLDIQLADGLSFSIFDQVKVESFVIFTTAYDEYAIRAFDLNSIDYLLKPVEAQRLSIALQKYARLHEKQPHQDLTALMQLLGKGQTKYKTHFWVNVATQLKKVETTEIVYLYSTEKMSFAYTTQGRERAIDYSLDQLEKILDPSSFFRISRQVIFNFEQIDHIEVLSKNRLKICPKTPCAEEFLVSTTRQTKFREWLDR